MKPRTLLLSTILFSIVLQPALAQSPQRGVAVSALPTRLDNWGAYHALIIGINDYKEWPRLRTAVKDAKVIRDTLVTRYGFNQKNVILRTDREASRRQITRDLRYLAKSMRKNDNLLVYYAGHGQLDDFTGDGYWVPAEGALKDPDTWVPNSFIKALLSSDKLQAKNVVVIADSCYSGSLLRGGPSLMSLDDQRYREKLSEKATLRSRQVISSGGLEPVTDGGADGHSLFAFYLISALRKNNREVIDLENLFHTRVWKPVTEIGNQRPNVGRLKTPMDEDGQFVLYNVTWAGQRAVQEAQKQAKARQKAAEMSVELELQRQRLEMEKQRMAYEKEQLAQQNAIEMERLKLERQKQEFEYAKLQARLLEMEKKQKSGDQFIPAEKVEAKPLQAAIPKNSLKSRSTGQSRIPLTLLPGNIYTSGWGTKDIIALEKATISGVAAAASNDGRVTFKYSYDGLKGSTEGVTLLADALPDEPVNVWKRESMFSGLKPDWKEVRKVGQKLQSRLIVTFAGNIGENNYEVFLYDTDTDTLRSREFRCYYMAYGQCAQDSLRDLIKDFFADQ